MKIFNSAKEALEIIKDNSSVMFGGFMCCGQPLELTEALLEQKTKNITAICNDAGFIDKGIGKLVVSGQIKHLITSHIGLNPTAGEKMNSGEMKVDLVPQGTMAEQIRCFGAGLGGVLTPTGIGTEVEKGKQIIEIDGKKYLLEKALGADFALIKAAITDMAGNCFIEKAEKNFNIVMAMAAKHTIVQTDKIVENGVIGPDIINLPGVFVHSAVEAKNI